MSMIKYDITPLNEDGTVREESADDSLNLNPEKIAEAEREADRVKEMIWGSNDDDLDTLDRIRRDRDRDMALAESYF